MHTGKAYPPWEFVLWTRRIAYLLVVVGITPVFLYQVIGVRWLVIPWLVVLLAGTMVALMSGFKSAQTYARAWEAQQVWSSIEGKSRAWGLSCRDFFSLRDESRAFAYRHLAWLTALRHAMRERRAWETVDKAQNVEYRRRYTIAEKEISLEEELLRYLAGDEVASTLMAGNRAAHVLSLQSAALGNAAAEGRLTASACIEMQKMVASFHEQQCRSELIKNVPYPRQYAIVSRLFIGIFCVLLPLGMIGELQRMDGVVGGFMQGHMVWLTIPLSLVISWMYASLDQVDESTANPFEGGANDVPVTQICRRIELYLKETLGEAGTSVLRRLDNDIVT